MSPCPVSIIRFVDEHQPGFAECEFTDANGTVHTLVDKVPIFSLEDLWNNSVYPQPGFARCEVLARRTLSRVRGGGYFRGSKAPKTRLTL